MNAPQGQEQRGLCLSLQFLGHSVAMQIWKKWSASLPAACTSPSSWCYLSWPQAWEFKTRLRVILILPARSRNKDLFVLLLCVPGMVLLLAYVVIQLMTNSPFIVPKVQKPFGAKISGFTNGGGVCVLCLCNTWTARKLKDAHCHVAVIVTCQVLSAVKHGVRPLKSTCCESRSTKSGIGLSSCSLPHKLGSEGLDFVCTEVVLQVLIK